MKDGFDKNIAEKMPRIQRPKPNRPWNVDPVLLKVEPAEEIARQTAPEKARPKIVPHEIPSALKSTENTLEEINSQFTHMILEKKDVRKLLDQKQRALDEALRQNTELKETLKTLQEQVTAATEIKQEMSFLHEQLQDADLYIRSLAGRLEEKERAFDEQLALRISIEERYTKLTNDLKGKAMLDVKASILERDLGAAHKRIQELEGLLEEESRKKVPLEEELVELKTAMDRVHASLSQIRLKAKREAYGV